MKTGRVLALVFFAAHGQQEDIGGRREGSARGLAGENLAPNYHPAGFPLQQPAEGALLGGLGRLRRRREGEEKNQAEN